MFLQGCNERCQVGELEEVLIARTCNTRLDMTLTLLWTESSGLLAGQVDATL